ncbi:MAG: carboxypeptidase regulatory-like domain-containing protein [Nitrospinae bacterium]|nr:carboxypeptidase regulatory-like domain-containing protein [Nitrospinota bacterium]
MRIKYASFLIVLCFLTTGCYATITGAVVNAETGEPIEGAVVLVEWTKTKGLPGMVYHEVYKIIEVETDKDGKFTLSGTFSPFVNHPDVVVYKAGYVAWRNDFIFPGWKKRTEFKYQNNQIVKLEKWKEGYSYEEHHSFMTYGIMGDSLDKTPKFSKAASEESKKAQQEVNKKKR